MLNEPQSTLRWRPVVAVAAFVAVQLKLATAAGGLMLWPYTRGDIWQTWPSELIYLLFTLMVVPPAALVLARRPPTLRAPLRSAALLLALAAAAFAIHHLFYSELMVQDGYSREYARTILFRVGPRIFHALLVLFLLLAWVIWGLLGEQARAEEERCRTELERRLALRASAAVRRNTHPRFIALRLEELSRTIADGGEADLVLHRIARHLRLLQRQKRDAVRLVTEMNLLDSIGRLSPISFDVHLPDELRDVDVPKGLAAAVADLATESDMERRFSVRVEAVPDGRVRVAIAPSTPDVRIAALLRARLDDDRELARSATVVQTGAEVVVTYSVSPEGKTSLPADEVGTIAVPPPVARWIPLGIVLIVGTRVAFVPSPDEVLNVSRLLLGLLWAGGAPLLAAMVARLRGPFFATLAAATALSAIVSGAVCMVAVELSSLLLHVPAIIPAGGTTWISLPRDSATIGTAVAVSVLLLHSSRRRSEERLRALHLETLLVRADAGALETGFHPHFLFNSLNTVLALLQEDRHAARLMVTRLAALFMDVLRGDTAQEWTLREERALIEKYLDVMRVRFGDRLRVEWRIPRAFETARVPRLVLQPLVENAIQHGIAERPGRGTIAISVARHGSAALSVTVENDTPSRVSLPPVGRGGLTYASERLALLYGKHSMPSYSAGESTFRVDFTIPHRA